MSTSRPSAAEIKSLRSLESKLASAQSELRLERSKRGQAERELSHAERSLETVLATKDRVARGKLRPGGKVSRGQATAILCCNDWHVEGCVSRQSVDGANEFNLAIADRRIRRTFQKALYLLDFARHISNIRDLVVWLGGDLINGTIHEELEESNFLGPAEAVLYVQDHVAAGLDLLLREAKVDGITVVTSYGTRIHIDQSQKNRSEGHEIETIARSHGGIEPVASGRPQQIQQVLTMRGLKHHAAPAMPFTMSSTNVLPIHAR